MKNRLKIKHGKCNGYKTNGHWSGYPCGAAPKFFIDNVPFCGNHFAKASVAKDRGHLAGCPAAFGFMCECGLE